MKKKIKKLTKSKKKEPMYMLTIMNQIMLFHNDGVGSDKMKKNI